ncbi:MAG: pre-peptidase C-terminal domain-containing protein [Burkholderiales bacterium]|nr:pre-peptidase C-terminal domain-containing protein [Burkholderiales bacterium]
MSRTSPWRATLAATALASALTTALAAAPAPRLSLPEAGASGQRAIDLLGDRLPEVAAWHKRSPEALREMLLRDPLMRLDRQGRVYVVDELEHPLPPAPEVGPQSAPGVLTAPLADTFKLHSRPGAKRTIYLDFNGAVLTNTAWNNGGGPITAQPFDADGNVNTNFSDMELERIQYIWQRVAEDYAPFDVDVTTEEPSPDKLTRSSMADEVYGTTALITNTAGVYNCSCGGVAYVGVFDAVGDFYKPALVFWNMLGSGNEKYVAEATSHEVGHNLGLSHDGYSGGGYYPGHGSGDTGWAPIMGVGYYQPVVQWSIGEYNTANNHEDDIVVMGNNGAPLRPDDHGNKAGKATALATTPNGSNINLTGSGVIERRKDKDVFKFTAGAGAGSITVSPDSRSANLDVFVKLTDAAGTVVAKAKPPTTLGATLSFNLPAAGTYYVTVDGVGVYDPATDGYSDYGSLGQYRVTGTVRAP